MQLFAPKCVYVGGLFISYSKVHYDPFIQFLPHDILQCIHSFVSLAF